MKNMPENAEIPALPAYVSVTEAAEIIGCTRNRVYQYIKSGQLSVQKIGNLQVLSREEVQQFRPNPRGRLRSKSPNWRTYRSHVKLSAMIIQVQVRKGQQKKLMKKLKAIESERHTFPGTIARYILGDSETIQIMFIWKDTEMPDEATRQEDFRSFQEAFADVLDWETAQICSKDVLLHT